MNSTSSHARAQRALVDSALALAAACAALVMFLPPLVNDTLHSGVRTMLTGLVVGIHRFATERYEVEIEYPVKVANGNEREVVFQTDTGPILFPDLDAEPEDLLARVELAFTAANAPDWAEFIVRVRTAVAEDVEVYHYAKAVRLDGIVNEFYLIPPDAPTRERVVELPSPTQVA